MCKNKQCRYFTKQTADCKKMEQHCDGFEIKFNLNNYQKLAERTMQSNNTVNNLLNAALGLSGESGEVADMVKKCMYQGHSLNRTDLLLELGDILWYIAQAARSQGSTLEEVAEMNIDKLKKRYPDGFDSNKSINRGDF